MLKQALKALVPYGAVEWWRKEKEKREAPARARFHEERHRRMSDVSGAKSAAHIYGDDREQVFTFLKSRGVNLEHLQGGSVPEKSLEYIRKNAIEQLGQDRPSRALHVGNFVGVSLAFLAEAMRRQHPGSLVVSIDPNLTHRTIGNPQSHVGALMTACGLQRNVLILAGYSGRKSISNDGVIYEGYDPQKEFANEFACEDTVLHLCALCRNVFDFIMIDGNHDGEYLTREIESCLPLMAPNAFVVLDDVDSRYWAEVEQVFTQISKFGLKIVGTDGRVGIARLA